MWCNFRRCRILFFIVLTMSYDIAISDSIATIKLNSHIRDFKTEDINNITNVKTLQKEESGRYANFAPTGNPIIFKEVPDSALSSSSNSRGLLYHDPPGYSLNEYEEHPYAHGHDYPLHDSYPDPHGSHGYGYDHDHHGHHDYHDHVDHHKPHDYDHHYGGHHYPGHGHYNKHFKHALAAKTVLWPLAGLAFLGAAAALVSNPVLLQLGVVSGKRRRRDTEEVTGPDVPLAISKYEENILKQTSDQIKTGEEDSSNSEKDVINIYGIKLSGDKFEKRLLKSSKIKKDNQIIALRKKRASVKRNINQIRKPSINKINYTDDERYIPIPIKLRSPDPTLD